MQTVIFTFGMALLGIALDKSLDLQDLQVLLDYKAQLVLLVRQVLLLP
jgi:hypothetical protein